MSDITARLTDALERIACLESDLEEEVIRRDRWEGKATELASDVGTLLGFDVGEHSNLNCPVQNAIDGVFEMQGTVHLWRQRDALQSRPAGWVSVDTPPKERELVQLYDEINGHAGAGHYCKGVWYTPEPQVICGTDVTHWQPITPPETAPVSTEEAK